MGLSESDAEADFEGWVLEGNRAESGGGVEMADCEYDASIGAYSFGGIVIDSGPFPGGVFPEGLGKAVA